MSETTQPKVHIVNLSRLLGMFQPELNPSLVNENNPKGWTGKYILNEKVTVGEPTRDQILNTAYAAMGDIKQFIKDHEQAKKDLADLREDAVKVHRLLMGAGMSVNAMNEGVEILFKRFKQCLDVISSFSKIEPAKLNAFQADAREFVLRFTREEKANSIFNKLPQAPAILESEIKPNGDAGENPDSCN